MASEPTRRAVPGPVDRESFFDAQRRNRRAAWRLSALSGLTVVLMGMPLAAVISPLLYGFLFLGADLLNRVTPTPDLFRLAFTTLDPVMKALDSPRSMPVGTAAGGAVLLLAPGAIALVLLWLALRALFLGGGSGGVVLTLGARAPRPDDSEERQLVNLIAEMAIAAGVPPPRVAVLDAAATGGVGFRGFDGVGGVGANAAVVGSSIKDAAVIVSRHLLGELDRDETEAIVGHLIASAANGDLRAALSMVSVYQALGLAATLLSAPFSRTSRADLRRFAGAVWRRRRGGAAAEQAVIQLLTRPLRGDGDDFDQPDQGKIKGFLRGILVLPFMTAYMSFFLTQALVTLMAVGPLAALAWRSRRYLADATAVQLTRDPDALARALAHLAREATAIPGAGWASHLFVVWPKGSGGDGSDSEPSMGFGIVSFQPSLERRLRRLQRMGAHLEQAGGDPAAALQPRSHLSPNQRLGCALVLLILAPLALLMIGLLLAAAALSVLVSLAIDGLFFFGLVMAPLHALLR